jgi:hypothetical protein
MPRKKFKLRLNFDKSDKAAFNHLKLVCCKLQWRYYPSVLILYLASEADVTMAILQLSTKQNLQNIF